MKITCTNLEQFTAVIANLVKHGLTFDSHAGTLTIDLTGGY